MNLLNEFDAQTWAKEFCLIVGAKIPAILDEQDWMRSWFANAIMTGYDKAIHNQTKIPVWEDFASMNYCPNGEISKNQLLHQCVAIISTHPKYEKLVPEEVYDAIIKHTKEVYNQ